MMKFLWGLVAALLIATVMGASSTIRVVYTCDDASWAGPMQVSSNKGERFTAELGFCSSGLVMWRVVK